jgi:DNA-binding transcriptional LysR family regulator
VDGEDIRMLEKKTGSSHHDSGRQAIDLISIRQALLVAEHLSFRQAASALGVRQSAVSRRVRSLEDILGVSLFERYHAGVRVTAAGAQFLEQARRALYQLDYAIKTAGAAGRGANGRLSIGIFSSIAAGFMRELMRAYFGDHPDVTIRIVASEHIALIRKRRLDVAFVRGLPVVPDCEVAQLWTERVFVALPHGHAFCAKDEIGWELLRNEKFILRQTEPGPQIHDYLIARLADLGYYPSVQRFDVGRDTLMHLVALGLGVSFASESATAASFPEVVFRPIAGDAELLPFGAVWSPSNDNPAFRRFLSLARILAAKWSGHRNGVTTPSLAGPTMHDLIGRSLVVLAVSVQMLGLLT